MDSAVGLVVIASCFDDRQVFGLLNYSGKDSEGRQQSNGDSNDGK